MEGAFKDARYASRALAERGIAPLSEVNGAVSRAFIATFATPEEARSAAAALGRAGLRAVPKLPGERYQGFAARSPWVYAHTD